MWNSSLGLHSRRKYNNIFHHQKIIHSHYKLKLKTHKFIKIIINNNIIKRFYKPQIKYVKINKRSQKRIH